MPDITMCIGGDCQLKEICFRYKATPSKFMQSYFGAPPFENLECKYFWEIKQKENEDDN